MKIVEEFEPAKPPTPPVLQKQEKPDQIENVSTKSDMLPYDNDRI